MTWALVMGVCAPVVGAADKKAPAAPTPARGETPAAPAVPPQIAERRNAAVLEALEAREKSERAGEVFRKFIEAKSAAERLPLILDSQKNAAAVKEYFSSSPNREFTPLAVQILGSVSSPSRPGQLMFPYFVATDKNKMGFLVMVVETAQGFKVDWPTFAQGHDHSLEEFLSARSPAAKQQFLLGIAKTHIFGEAPAGGDARWAAYSIEMPLPREDQDPAKIYVEKESKVGRELGEKLGWARGHLCFLTLTYMEGETPFLKAIGYEPYAK